MGRRRRETSSLGPEGQREGRKRGAPQSGENQGASGKASPG